MNFYLKNISILLLISATCVVRAQELSYYGMKITEEDAITSDELLTKLGDADSMVVKVKGEITESCKMKGCWMDMKLSNGEVMKIKFKDYAFFVPKGITNKEAVVSGVLRKEVIPVKTLKHYAKDAGKSPKEIKAITEPKVSLTFVADGVILRN